MHPPYPAEIHFPSAIEPSDSHRKTYNPTPDTIQHALKENFSFLLSLNILCINVHDFQTPERHNSLIIKSDNYDEFSSNHFLIKTIINSALCDFQIFPNVLSRHLPDLV
jgi:hypothetical protein